MVSSRSKTAAENAANKRATRSTAIAGTAPSVPDVPKVEQESKKKAAQKKIVPSEPPASPASTVSKSTGKGKRKGGGTYCLCKGEDDGTPMIKCDGGCRNWFHFRCIDLDEDVAGEIERYVCPECEAKTGRKTVSKLDFEGTDAFVVPPPVVAPHPVAKKARKRTPVEEIDVVDSPEETDGAGSEDDYVAEPSSRKAKSAKRPGRQAAVSSDETESDADGGDSDAGRRQHPPKSGRLKRLKKASASPAPESSHKRRTSSAPQPTPKRSRTAESAHDDAIRKYCLSKLEEFIRPMFEEYQRALSNSQAEGQAKEDSSDTKEPVSSSAEMDKSELEQKVKSFVTELERCMMETYAEPDKTGKPSAGGKYKERFRMLQFNLPKPDRVALRQGIASGRITPSQLNVMSSTDLADEQTKHVIEQAEKEALEHSILQKITAPRAKITHKGLETIEDMSGQRAADAAREEEEQRMEMEKREREKVARLRTQSISQQQQGSPTSATAQSPSSATFPKPNSPVTAADAQYSWGAPPPVPSHAHQSFPPNIPPASPTTGRPSVRPLFMPSMVNELASAEQGLSLDDIIHMDDDVPMTDSSPVNPQQRTVEQVSSEAGPSSSPTVTMPSGPSPFAPPKPAASPQRSSFDLNALWTGSEKDKVPSGDEKVREQGPAAVPDTASPMDNARGSQEEAMDLDSNDDDSERALDAILEQSATAELTTESDTRVINSLPEVWTGLIAMPKENFEILAIDVSCKQIAGRSLEPLSGYWQTLFPTPQARIDGRVPTAQSNQYLVSVRMNSSKELIVVIFSPRSTEATAKFDELIDFLIRKDRHALVFPWGAQPKPQAPGRELYLIPVLKDKPLPEFVELMDDHRVPKERTVNILLGAFVLNKGKLVATAPGGPASVVPPFPSVPNPPPPVPSVPPAAAAQASQPSVAPNVPPGVDQAALAAEFASLTPEQISLMLRHLSQSVPLPNTGAYTPASAPAPPPAPYSAPSMPPFPPQFPPANQAQPPAGQYSPSGRYSPSRPQGHFGEQSYDDRDDRGRDYGRDGYSGRGAGWRGSDRGRRGQRGRGKSYYDDRGPRPAPNDNNWGGSGRGGPSR